MFFFIDFNKEKTVEFPFEATLFQGVFYLWMGVLFFFLFQIISKLVVSANSFDIVKPFVVFSTTSSAQTLSTQYTVITLQTSTFIVYLYNVWVHPILETWIFNIVGMMLGYIVGMFITEFLWKNALSDSGKKFLRFIMGLTFSGITFMVAHLLNKTYESIGFFIVALIFITLVNVLLYYANFVFMFAVGFHMANNFFANFNDNFAGAFQTWPGWILNFILIATIIYLFLNIKKAKELLKDYSPGL